MKTARAERWEAAVDRSRGDNGTNRATGRVKNQPGAWLVIYARVSCICIACRGICGKLPHCVVGQGSVMARALAWGGTAVQGRAGHALVVSRPIDGWHVAPRHTLLQVITAHHLWQVSSMQGIPARSRQLRAA